MRGSQQVGRLNQFALGDAGDAFDPLRPVGGNQSPHVVESLSAAGDVIEVKQAIADDNVEQSVGQGRVGARYEPEVQIGAGGGGSEARIGYDEFPAGGFLLLEILHHGGHCFGGVATHHEDDLCAGDVLQREGQAAIQPEGANAGPGCR